MKILFNAYNCGLGNNGGSQTIIRSAEVLDEMGHDCIILTKVNMYTLNKHKAEIISDLPLNSIRFFDAIINVSAWEIEHTLSLKHPNSYWWLRLWEDYVAGINILEYIKKIPMLVNSIGLMDKLSSYGVESEYVPQGIDIDFWRCIGNKPKKPRIGFLAHNKKRKRTMDALEIIDKMGDRFNCIAVGGGRLSNTIRNELKRRNIPLVENLDREGMRDYYSSCDIWLQTSDSEGLCNMAMEAALCDCLIIANSEGMSGVDAYHPYTLGYYDIDHTCTWLKQYPFKNKDKFIKNCRRLIITNIGDRKKCMKKLVEVISKQNQ